ncbi:MAG TPA: L,D-transpeptidase, partial [Microbacterium sp.]|nr:L,D-transpeptidase [Microbacterium sp.]
RYGGTTVPVIERQQHWVRVLLTGRQSLPSAGDSGQVTGWLRAQDVEFGTTDSRIEVDLSDRTVDIVSAAGTERVATDFASGREDTPTPIGRSFVMLVETVSFAYTRGHPMVYLSVQSPTIDDFDESDAAVTAFHYHDDRTGAISNGCIRLDPAAIDRLALLPVGTPVIIRE